MSKIDFTKLLAWSNKNFPDLPWRVHRSLYGTLVSEIMLQQTTVGTVVNYFLPFLKKYPNVSALANTTEEEILIAWKGLGYYRRAKNLRRAAIEINEKFSGKIPENYDDLVSIKGIGEYTASALLSIGGNQRALAIDANILRVVSRIYKIKADRKEIAKKFVKSEILEELSSKNARNYNEALMDLGREICMARKVSCEICPMGKSCRTYLSGESIIFKEPKIKDKSKLTLLRVIHLKNGRPYFYQKKEGEWLSGQWELPTYIISTDDEKLKQYPRIEIKDFESLKKFKSSITKYEITNFVTTDREGIQLPKGKHLRVKDDLNISTSSMKALKLLGLVPHSDF